MRAGWSTALVMVLGCSGFGFGCGDDAAPIDDAAGDGADAGAGGEGGEGGRGGEGGTAGGAGEGGRGGEGGEGGHGGEGGEGGAPSDGPSLIDDPLGDFPERLSQVGLFEDVADPSSTHERALAYAPQYPLWSNGSDKTRYLVLPEGEAIASSDEGFSFPPGTLFFKNFAFAVEDAGGEDGLFNAELRVMRRTEERWEFAAYRYDDDGADGVLLEGRVAEEIGVELPSGEVFDHAVPSRRQCRICHESAPVSALGFTALQLDYDDGDGNVLERLEAAGAFDGDATRVPPIDSGDAETDWVLGYVTGNCTHCHNGHSGLANASFDLRYPVFLEQTLGVDTQSSGSGVGVRIVPGDPDSSVLYLAFTARDNGTGIEAMPPLGVQLRDAATAERIRAWIAGLEVLEPDE